MKFRKAYDDRGAAAIFIASSLFLLAGFVALSIDIGAGTDERRQDQTGADSAALGGSLELVIYSGTGNPMQGAVDKIDALVEANLGRSVPESAWNACTDPGALFYPVMSTPMFGVTTNESDCISLSQNRNTLRVRLPTQPVDTTFGQVIGASAIAVSAFAEAARNTENGGASGAFPTGVLDGTPPGTELCVKTGSGSQPSESCAGPSTGDFGLFHPYFYESVNGDPTSICDNTHSTQAMGRAIADGVDHYFSISPVPDTDPAFTPYINGYWCAAIPGPPFPNQVDAASGFQESDVTVGLIKGTSDGYQWPSLQDYDGRLTRGPYAYADPSMRVRLFEDKFAAGDWYTIDNRPLWDYIDDVSTLLPSSCEAARAYPEHPGSPALVYEALAWTKTCLLDADTEQIFTSDIGLSPRLAGVPLYWEDTKNSSNACVLGDPDKCYTIQDFVPIFIEGLWVPWGQGFVCDPATLDRMLFTPGDSDDVCVHHPGMTGDIDVKPPGAEKVDSVTGLLLRCTQLPTDVCAVIEQLGGPRDLTGKYDLQLTR